MSSVAVSSMSSPPVICTDPVPEVEILKLSFDLLVKISLS